MKVDTREMMYNPMDEFGYQQIEEGDWVSVSGDIDFDMFEDKEIVAETIVTIIEE